MDVGSNVGSDVRLNIVSEVGLDVGSEGKETRQIIFFNYFMSESVSENGSSREASASKK